MSKSSNVIVAEGNNYGPSYKIAKDLTEVFDEYESKELFQSLTKRRFKVTDGNCND